MKIGIFGAGSWGTAMGNYLAGLGDDVLVYARQESLVEEYNRNHINSKYFPKIKLHENLRFSSDKDEVLAHGEWLINAISTQAVREFYEPLKGKMRPEQVIINLSKGIEKGTLLTLEKVFEELFPNQPYVSLSGPSHAEEVIENTPTTLVAASKDLSLAESIQRISSNVLRVYTSTDVIGVESGGALKNVIAIAIGISDGKGFGDNTKAAIMTRGMNEILKLGLAMGAKPETYLGLSGFGDLIVTCLSQHSRNRRCGELIGQGCSVSEAKEKVGMVVEGLSTIESAMKLSKKYNIEMPIIEVLYGIIGGELSLDEAVRLLMEREVKIEYNHA